MAVIALGLMAVAAAGGGAAYYAKRRQARAANDGGEEGKPEGEEGQKRGWRQRLNRVGKASSTDENSNVGDATNSKETKTGEKKSRFNMPKMPKVNVPTANGLKVMIAKKKMGL